MRSKKKFRLVVIGISTLLIVVLSGCGGGSMGTGVRTYKFDPELAELPMLDGSGAQQICEVETATGTIKMTLGSDVGDVTKLNLATGRCTASISPQAQEIKLQLLLPSNNRQPPKYKLEAKVCQAHETWHEIDNSSAVVDKAERHGFVITVSEQYWRYQAYRIVLELRDQSGTEISYEFYRNNPTECAQFSRD